MKVYHGSDTFVEIIDLTKAKPRKDFGQGFYVTAIYEQAARMADRVAEWHHTTPVITEYEFDEFAYIDSVFQCVRFEDYSEKWLDFIILNRNNKLPAQAHHFDIVEGPVADDAVTVKIDDYLLGKISKADFMAMLTFHAKTHQICFCTQKSLQMLELSDKNIENKIFHIDEIMIRRLMSSTDLSDIEASDIYYKSKTYAQLVAKNSDTIDKSEEIIYQLLQKELLSNR
jgi:hypothetical protein